MRIGLAAALAGIVLTACGGASDPSPSASTVASQSESVEESPSDSPAASTGVPEGWELVNVDDEGFAVALPDGWLKVSAEDLAATGLLEQMMQDNPEAAGVMEQARQAIENGQMSFLAFETGQPTVETGFAANLNIVRTPDDGRFTTDEVAAQMKLALPMQIPGLEVVETDTIVLPAGEAAFVRSRWTLQAGQAATPLSLTQYAIMTDGAAHILSFTALDERAADYTELWAGIAESFRLN